MKLKSAKKNNYLANLVDKQKKERYSDSPAGKFDMLLEKSLFDIFMDTVEIYIFEHCMLASEDFENNLAFEQAYRNREKVRGYIIKAVFNELKKMNEPDVSKIKDGMLESIVKDFCDSQCGLSKVFNSTYHNLITSTIEETKDSKVYDDGLSDIKGPSENDSESYF